MAKNGGSPIIKDGVYDPLAWLDAYSKKDDGNPQLPEGVDDGDGGGGGTDGGSGGSGGGYGGGGGSGGGSADNGQQYIEDYRLKFFKGEKPPKELLSKAIANNWSLAYFEQQVRLKDPRYYKSLEARTLLPQFNNQMKIMFPGLANKTKQAALMQNPFYKRIALWYLKNGIGTLGEAGMELLYTKVTNTRRWNKQNPTYRTYLRNKDAAVQAESNPIVFKQLEAGMKQAFQNAGVQMHDSYYKEFFKSRYASSSGIGDLVKNLGTIAATGGSYSWFQGQPTDRGTVKTAAFSAGKKGTDLRSRMNQAFGVRQSFLGSDQQGFDTAMNKQGKLVKQTI
jgi:hypothetical protein